MPDDRLDVDFNVDFSSAREKLQAYTTNYLHIITLIGLMLFMVIVRLRNWSNIVKEDGSVVFLGKDAWYHFRETNYIVNNWPQTMPYDVFTGYPTGHQAGQFGTIYDQFVATVALIVGGGDPSTQTVALVGAFMPVLFGALTIIPVYYIGRRLDSEATGIFAAGVLALSPGLFFRRTSFGFFDHHAIEAFLMAVAVAILMYTIRKAEKEVMVIEVLHSAAITRDFSEVKGFLKYSALAGFGVGLYIYVWPPGVLLIGIFALFLMVKSSIDILQGTDCESPLLFGGFAMLVTTIMTTLAFDSASFGASEFGYLQIFFPLATAIGAFTLVGFDRYLDTKNLDKKLYPVGIIGGLTTALLGMYFALPTAFSAIKSNFLRTFSLGLMDDNTISEANPMGRNITEIGTTLFQEYGAMFFVALFGLGVLFWGLRRTYQNENYTITGEYLFFVVWFITITLAAITQVRLNYYLVLPVAAAAGYAITTLISLINIPDEFPRMAGYQYIALLFVLLLFIPVLVYPLQGAVVMQGENQSPQEYSEWEGSLDWMEDNTPAVGTYGGEDNQMNPTGTYEAPDDGDYAYEDGSYGVLSWWDYGHWLTNSERVPVSNPFQQHASESAELLLSQNDEEREEIMQEMSDDGEEQPRYVMVDWKMVTSDSKLHAVADYHPEVEREDMFEQVLLQNEEGQVVGQTYVHDNRYYNSLMVRLYYHHGSQVPGQYFFLNYEEKQLETQNGETVTRKVANQQDFINTFQTEEELNAYAENNTGQKGGLGILPSEEQEALTNYRMVHISESKALNNSMYSQSVQMQAQSTGVGPQVFYNEPSSVKTFERVEGATIEGSNGPANSTVQVRVNVQMPDYVAEETPIENQTQQQQQQQQGQQTSFVWQTTAETDEDGNFEVVVPYATSGHDEWGPEEGYTDASVHPEEPYTITAFNTDDEGNPTQYQGTADVTEAQVIGEDDSATTIELEASTPEPPEEGEDGSGSGDGSQDSGTQDGSETQDGSDGG